VTDVASRLETSPGIEGEVSQMHVGEVELALPLLVSVQADGFARKGFAHMIVVPFM
jgi:hypothetical protein